MNYVIWCTVHHSTVLILMLCLSCRTNALLKNHTVASGLLWNFPHNYCSAFPDQVTQRTVLKSNLPALSDSHLILCDSSCEIIPAALTSACTAAKPRCSYVSPCSSQMSHAAASEATESGVLASCCLLFLKWTSQHSRGILDHFARWSGWGKEEEVVILRARSPCFSISTLKRGNTRLFFSLWGTTDA